MRFSRSVLLPMLYAASACSGGATSGYTELATNTTSGGVPDKNAVLEKIYDPAYAVPAGFLVDERAADPSRSYTVHHVLDESDSYELCTDSFETARAWEDADNSTRSVQGYFIGVYETGRYYEFIRELSYTDDVGNVDDVTSPGYARVFKCSDTNRDGVDRNLLNGYAGLINTRPLESETVRVFTEYLWQFTFFPQSRKAVLDSYAGTTAGSLTQTLELAFATNQGAERCDLIEVARWQFIAERATGEVRKQFDVLMSFEARLDNGVPVTCH